MKPSQVLEIEMPLACFCLMNNAIWGTLLVETIRAPVKPKVSKKLIIFFPTDRKDGVAELVGCRKT